MSAKLKLGFVGLGIMGAPMAGQLIKAGHEVFVYTRSKVAPEIAQSSAIQCASAAEVAQKADIIFTMVPDTPDVERVLFGENGIVSGLSKGKIVVDMSSISPIATKEFAKKINVLGCDYLDAPVSGGEVGAKNATLSIMVGGDEKVFEKIKPIFELMGKNINLVGSKVIIVLILQHGLEIGSRGLVFLDGIDEWLVVVVKHCNTVFTQLFG